MSPVNIDWLQQFFASPNGLTWTDVSNGTEPAAVAEVLRPWLALLADSTSTAPVILPFVRAGAVTGWYAVARSTDRSDELRDMLTAWFGYTWLSRFEATTPSMSDPLAAIIRNASGGTVFRFGGGDAAANRRIASELVTLAYVLSRKPPPSKVAKRPIGVIRAEFDRALLLRDEASAAGLLEELRGTGRFSNENLRYLDVRFRAGLGLWPQLANDHWLVKTLSELVLPPQILADLIEALYRTHLDHVEAEGDPQALMDALNEHISGRYPSLFASRRGVRTPRVVKAFLVFERCQSTPNPQIINDLAELLPKADRDRPPFHSLCTLEALAEPTVDPAAAADAAFEDNQFDRAFEYYLNLTPTLRSLGRAILCASFIDTAEITSRLSIFLAEAEALGDQLSSNLKAKFVSLLDRHTGPQEGPSEAKTAVEVVTTDWRTWSQSLRKGAKIPLPNDAAVTWDASLVLQQPEVAKDFADSIGILSSDTALARQAVPIIYAAFIENRAMAASAKPIAMNLCMLIAMDESLSRVDLALLAQLAADLQAMGMSDAEYVSLVDVLSEVENRVASYIHLAWALDMAEALAIAPAPSDAAQRARAQFFHLVVAKAQTFAHRLRPDERHTFRTLSRDFETDPAFLGPLGVKSVEEEQEILPNLSGKTIGIYTLVEAAGARAKTELEAIFPGVSVVVNGDHVATDRLAHLASSADYFVFAWRSSSHAAFYAIKAAMKGRELILPQGKGTASILRAVIDAVQ